MSFIDFLPSAELDAVYEPPTVERLGTLADLTLGGGGEVSDGFGTSGDEGSIPL